MCDGLVLGVDCGTQGLRAGLYAPDGALLAQAARAYPTLCPRINWAEQNPEDWWDALCGAVRECLAIAKVSASAVMAIACDGTSYTGVFCTERGEPLRSAILWMDLRATAEAQHIEDTGDPALDTCGRRVSPEWFLPKALWGATHEPDLYAKSDRIVEGVDWLVHQLCGRWVTSNSNASGKLHWTPAHGLPVAFYERVGLPDLARKCPDAVVYLGEPAGCLLPEAAAALGLNRNCVVAHAGMDAWTAYLGGNCLAPGCASLSLGTSNVVIVETAEPKLIPGTMGPFPDGIRRGLHAYEAGQTSGASTIGWIVSLLGHQDTPEAHERLSCEAASIPAGSEGIIVFDAWRGNRTPYYDPSARGTICGLTLEHTPAHVYRSVLEGCAYGIRNALDTFERGGCAIDELRATGSGAANRLWMHIIATVTGTPVHISGEKHATCRGAAVCATVACGLHANLPDAAAAMAPDFESIEPGPEGGRYDECFELYRQTYQNMRVIMKRLSDLA